MADYRLRFWHLDAMASERSKLAAYRRRRGSSRPLPGFLWGYNEGFHDGAIDVMRSFGAEDDMLVTAGGGLLGWHREQVVGLVLPGPSACTPQSHPACHSHCRECWQEGYEAGLARMRKHCCGAETTAGDQRGETNLP